MFKSNKGNVNKKIKHSNIALYDTVISELCELENIHKKFEKHYYNFINNDNKKSLKTLYSMVNNRSEIVKLVDLYNNVDMVIEELLYRVAYISRNKEYKDWGYRYNFKDSDEFISKLFYTIYFEKSTILNDLNSIFPIIFEDELKSYNIKQHVITLFKRNRNFLIHSMKLKNVDNSDYFLSFFVVRETMYGTIKPHLFLFKPFVNNLYNKLPKHIKDEFNRDPIKFNGFVNRCRDDFIKRFSDRQYNNTLMFNSLKNLCNFTILALEFDNKDMLMNKIERYSTKESIDKMIDLIKRHNIKNRVFNSTCEESNFENKISFDITLKSLKHP